jgi:hypothetical protein
VPRRVLGAAVLCCQAGAAANSQWPPNVPLWPFAWFRAATARGFASRKFESRQSGRVAAGATGGQHVALHGGGCSEQRKGQVLRTVWGKKWVVSLDGVKAMSCKGGEPAGGARGSSSLPEYVQAQGAMEDMLPSSRQRIAPCSWLRYLGVPPFQSLSHRIEGCQPKLQLGCHQLRPSQHASKQRADPFLNSGKACSRQRMCI